MNFIGKYSLKIKDKNNNIINSIQKKNIITKKGQQQILKILQNASMNETIHCMDQYDVLDLKPYNITPVFENNNSTYIDYEIGQNNEEPIKTTNYLLFDSHDKTWQVKSSFFFHQKWDNSKLRLPPLLKNSSYYRDRLDEDYLTFKYYDIIKGGIIQSNYNFTDFNNMECEKNIIYSQDEIDSILLDDNKRYYQWGGCKLFYDRDSYVSLNLNVQNIDFFRTYCKQDFILYVDNFIIDLWSGGMLVNGKFQKRDVVYKKNYINNSQKNCINVKYLKLVTEQYNYSNLTIDEIRNKINENNIQLLTLPNNCFSIDELNHKIKFFNSSELEIFSDQINLNAGVYVFIEYYTHIIDSQLQKGICGMYLDYQYTKLNNSQQYFGRSFFGNGVFSNNAGQNWDDYMVFPWCGSPKRYGNNFEYDYAMFNIDDQMYYNSDWNINSQDRQQITTGHVLLTNFQDKDQVLQHFYSFYPYIYKCPTNFCFLTYFYKSYIKIKKFLFLIPKIKPQLPNLFVFGTNDKINNEYATSQSTSQNDICLNNQIFRKKSLKCYYSKEQNKYKIIWKTVIDFQQLNNQEIKQIGLCYRNVFDQPHGGNWYHLRPFKQQDCTQLFSRTILSDNDKIIKNEQQTIQVTYELELQ